MIPFLFSGTDDAGTFQVILSTDDTEYGGFGRINKETKHITDPLGYCNRRNFVQVSETES